MSSQKYRRVTQVEVSSSCGCGYYVVLDVARRSLFIDIHYILYMRSVCVDYLIMIEYYAQVPFLLAIVT